MKRSLLIAALLLGACNSPSPTTPDAAEIGTPGQGQAVVRLMLPHLKPLQGQYLNPTKTASLTVQVDSGPLTTLNLADLTCTSAGCPVNLYVSAGTHTFSVKSYSASSVLISQGTRSLNVILGQNNALELVLDPVITSTVLRSAVQQVDPVTRVIGNYTRFPYANGRSLVAYYDVLAKDAVGDPIPSILCGDAGVAIANISNANFPNRFRVELITAGTHTLTAKTGSSCAAGSILTTQAVTTIRGAGVASGRHHSLALMADGTVRSWGENGDGQLGDGTNTWRSTPVTVSGLSGVVGLASRGVHTLALMADGTVRSWGNNGYGQLGDGTTGINRSTPVTVSGLNGVVGLASGYSHSLALMADGTVRSWGNNGYGQLGDGTIGTNRSTPVTVSGLNGVVGLASGSIHSLALMADGTVRSWGYNGEGQMGDGTIGINRSTPVTVSGLNGVVGVGSGYVNSLVLMADGTVRSWGLNRDGQVGDGTNTNRSTPVTVSGLNGVVGLAGGYSHSLALRADGTVRSWGGNGGGQLGDGTNISRATPVTVSGLNGVVGLAGGSDHNLALMADGTVRGWGFNGYGQVGDGTNTNRSTPVTVLGITTSSPVAVPSP